MIIDFLRIPVDEYGNLMYDFSDCQQIFKKYEEVFPEHQVFMMPANISVWEDLDLDTLKYMRQCLDDMITKKEQQYVD